MLPTEESELRRLARSLGLRESPVEQLQEEWRRHSVEVRRLHEKLFYRPLLAAVARLPAEEARLSTAAAEERLEALGFADPRRALEHIQALIPDEWLPAAVGAASHCADRVLDQLAAGADGVILHGSAPAELEPVVQAYAAVRPDGAFAGREANPGR